MPLDLRGPGGLDRVLLSARSLTGDVALGTRLVLPALGWATIASFLAVVVAAATYIDVKLGIVVVGALMVGAVVMTRPPLILCVASATIFVEALTFNGMAITRLLAPAALLLTLAELLRGSARVRLGAPLAWVGAYVSWALLSGIWTASVPGTRFLLQSLAIALVFLLAFAALLNTERDLRQILYVLAFTAAFVGGLSVVAFRGDLGFGFIDLLQAGRSQGGVGDPDFFAAMQIMCVPLVLVLASETTDRRLRLLLYVSTLVILASVFTSLSRGAFIGVVVLGLLFVASRPEHIFRARHEKAIALVVVAIGLAAFFSRPFVREEVVTRAETIYAPKSKSDKSGTGRTELWKAAAKTAGENPAFGIGFGSFSYVSQQLLFETPGVDPELIERRREAGENKVAHNLYLGTAAELGLTGLALYIGLILSTALTLRRTVRRAFAAGAPFVGRVAHALLLGVVSWSITSVFLSGETARIFWIVVGLSLALPKLFPEPERPRYFVRSKAPMS
jgi:putative inorganic carbon (hco3(-)) transporter